MWGMGKVLSDIVQEMWGMGMGKALSDIVQEMWGVGKALSDILRCIGALRCFYHLHHPILVQYNTMSYLQYTLRYTTGPGMLTGIHSTSSMVQFSIKYFLNSLEVVLNICALSFKI
jgi:hypothetical protein